MEAASRSDEPNRSSNPNPLSSIISSAHVWPTIDGPLGLTEEASVDYARRFYKFGFALLRWLWAVNCFYFWPVLRHSRAFPQIRNYVVRSAIGFSVFTALLSAWALTFSIGGNSFLDLFGISSLCTMLLIVLACLAWRSLSHGNISFIFDM